MCGIAGIVSEKPIMACEEIAKMTSRLEHRGPDGWGYASLSPGYKPSSAYQNAPPEIPAHVHLGHRRLSIIDIDGARQPLCNEDGSVWVVFNGEIYNYMELADLLRSKGHILSSKGDTETLVHLWEEFGTEMLPHLVGMFAFAIYDLRKGTLFLARDRFGQKPLYYAEKAETLFFASELQAFEDLDLFKNSNTDKLAIAQYFRYGFIPSPRTAYKEISSLQAGHFLIKRNGQHDIRQYWKPSVSGELQNPDLDKLQSLIDESVRIRMRSDVPLGAFLSGGIDSALLVSSMARQSNNKVRTFTISTGKEYWVDESITAGKTAEHIGTEHNELKVSPDFISVWEKLSRHYGQPFADHSAVMTYYVSRETRRFVKVALSGDGGDELFAGYNGYLRTSFYNVMGHLPKSVRNGARRLASLLPLRSGRRDYADAILSAFSLPRKGENIASLFHESWRDELFDDDFKRDIKEDLGNEADRFSSFYNEAQSDDPVSKWLEADQRLYLCDDILCKLDIASMSVSLECRSPFLDHRIAEYANRISSSAKIAGGRTKAPLRELALRRLPAEISALPKKGFSMPLAEWMRKELKNSIEDRIFSCKSSWRPYLREDAVKRLWKEHLSGKADHQMRLWMIFVLAGMKR